MFKGDRDSSRNLTYLISDKDLTFFFLLCNFPFLYFVIFFSFIILFLYICEQVCNSLQTYSKGEGKNRKEDLEELVSREKKGKEGDRKREVIRKGKKKSFSSFNNSQKLYISQAFELVGVDPTKTHTQI